MSKFVGNARILRERRGYREVVITRNGSDVIFESVISVEARDVDHARSIIKDVVKVPENLNEEEYGNGFTKYHLIIDWIEITVNNDVVHTHDRETDAHYFYVNPGESKVASTVSRTAQVDLDRDGDVLGVEVIM